MSRLSTDMFLNMVRHRRSVYPLTKDLGSVTAQRILSIVSETAKHTPSAFNLQANRTLVLFGADNDKLWEETRDILRGLVAPDRWEGTSARMDMLAAAAGTVLFFRDEPTLQAGRDRLPVFADRLAGWADQGLGMQQWITWTALELEGLGANLQHYNPLVDGKVREHWGVPDGWVLDAQLVFGGRVEGHEPAEKSFVPVEDRVRSFGA
ncbi:uncharacterized protein GMORB2_1648 [Geosmithia morbida]|uniref:Nitroreductase domain-containing protein n=1 Tax=Geosmithia morbida TaxID=1094350 RepID=A0A9P4YU41_9HYPO|nr:uncharacterized protein GMORB2_1648 [Geosmithia morbida]KAF4121809.1 uncharacterized protein GMORB2_1648 [Geosmithia morbida]